MILVAGKSPMIHEKNVTCCCRWKQGKKIEIFMQKTFTFYSLALNENGERHIMHAKLRKHNICIHKILSNAIKLFYMKILHVDQH